MHYILLDTNTWIYLANGTEPFKLLDFLNKEVDKGTIRIILPKTVEDEWNEHRVKTVTKDTLKYIKQLTDSLDRISQLFGERPPWDFLLVPDEKDAQEMAELVNQFKRKKARIEAAIERNIQIIENIFENERTEKVEISNEVKIEAGNLALKKSPPFGNKNSYADALILLSFMEFIKKEGISGAMFVSYNTEDFCKKENGKKNLHPELETLFKETNSKFYKIVGEALRTIQENIIDEETLAFIEERKEYLDELDSDVCTCLECDGYEGFGNIVSFDPAEEIMNEAFESIESNDPNQMELFDEFEPTTATKNGLITSVQFGSCEHCGTLHLKCQGCDEVFSITHAEFDKKIECPGCSEIYFVESSSYYDSGGEFDIRILDKRREECNGCGKEFIDVIGSGMCLQCEKEYADK